MKSIYFIFVFITLLFAGDIDIKSTHHNSKYIKVTRKIIEKKDKELEQFFGLRDFPIHVLLFNSHKIFRDSCGLGENVQGVLLSNRNVIFLKTPAITGTKLDEYSRLINHELVHLFHNHKMPIVLFPDWFSEGIAVYLSNEFQLPQKVALSKLLLNKHLPTILQLQQFDINHSARASSEYILSASIIEFLIQTYGNNVLLDIFAEMEQSKNFYSSLKHVTKLDLSLFNYYWKQYINQHYSSFFLLDLQYILWLFLPFLFIFSLIVKLIQNQMIINSWKYEVFEEEINNIFTDPSVDNEHCVSPGTISVK